MLILIIVLILLFGVGGGWYGNGRWYGTSAQPGVSPGFNPMGIIWIILIIILIIWLVEEAGLFSHLRL